MVQVVLTLSHSSSNVLSKTCPQVLANDMLRPKWVNVFGRIKSFSWEHNTLKSLSIAPSASTSDLLKHFKIPHITLKIKNFTIQILHKIVHSFALQRRRPVVHPTAQRYHVTVALQHPNKRHKVRPLQPVLVQVVGGSIARCYHDYAAIKQIRKQPLENHRVRNVGDLKKRFSLSVWGSSILLVVPKSALPEIRRSKLATSRR